MCGGWVIVEDGYYDGVVDCEIVDVFGGVENYYGLVCCEFVVDGYG